MNEQTDSQLLRAFTEQHSDPAFAELVRRHIDLVHSAALRMVCDTHLAQDVTQAVFIALAKNAAQLTKRPILSGWLHRTAQNIAAQTVRTDVRRRAREQEAAAMNELLSATPDVSWDQIEPHLDTALGQLDESERDALLFRYFERKSAREMATQLGISDDAAQKRVSRAVERLREFFAKRGITVGASALVVAISANAVQAAPVGIALTISTAATLAGAAVATTIATQTTMNWINLKSGAAILAAALAAGSGTYLAKNHETNALQQEVQALQSEKTALLADRENALAGVESGNTELAKLRENQNDLLRLRAEVAALRKQSAEVNQLREQNLQLRAALQNANQATSERNADAEDEQLRQQAILRMNDAKQLAWALRMFAEDNQDRLPLDLSQTTNYWKNANGAFTNSDNFEQIIYGSLKGLTNLANIIVVREKQASYRKGKRAKAYGFADGHSEIKIEPTEGFEEWEKAHMAPPPGQP